MDKHKWINLCKEVPLGQSKKVQCCGTDRSRILNNLNDRYVTYCFRCKETFSEPKSPLLRLTEQEQRSKISDTLKKSNNYLPRDFTKELPTHVVAWLSKAGLHQSVWEAYGIGWSPYMQRAVIPVRFNGKRVGVLTRGFDNQIKYVLKTDTKGDVYTCKPRVESSTVILTEDILSAIKVQKSLPEFDVCSILGTSIHTGKFLWVIQNYSRVILWFDNDKAGHEATEKWRARLAPHVERVAVWSSNKDPKELPTSLIIRKGEQYVLGNSTS